MFINKYLRINIKNKIYNKFACEINIPVYVCNYKREKLKRINQIFIYDRT